MPVDVVFNHIGGTRTRGLFHRMDCGVPDEAIRAMLNTVAEYRGGRDSGVNKLAKKDKGIGATFEFK